MVGSYCNCHQTLPIQTVLCFLIVQVTNKFDDVYFKKSPTNIHEDHYHAGAHVKVWLQTLHYGKHERNFVLKFLLPWGPMLTKTKKQEVHGIGALLDNCSWYNKWRFSADFTCIKNSLLQTKPFENLGLTLTVPHHQCINFRSSTP